MKTRLTYILLALFATIPVPRSSATLINPGYDLFQTAPGASVDLSPLGAGIVPLKGVPIVSPVGLVPTDTIIRRLTGVSPFPAGDPGPYTVPTEVFALSMVSIAPTFIPAFGGIFDVHVTINNSGGLIPFSAVPQYDPLTLSTGLLTNLDHILGGGTVDGHFNSSLTVFADLIFSFPGSDPSIPANVFTSFAAPSLNLTSVGSTWSHTPPPGYPTDPNLPAGFFYPVAVNHTGPHPIIPAPEPTTALSFLLGLGVLASRRYRQKRA